MNSSRARLQKTQGRLFSLYLCRIPVVSSSSYCGTDVQAHSTVPFSSISPDMSSPTNTSNKPAAQAAASGTSSPGGKALSAKDQKRLARAARVAGRVDQAPPTQGAPAAGGSRQAPAANEQQQSGPSRHRRAIAAEAVEKAAPPPPPNASSQFFSHLPMPRGPGTADALISDKIHPVVVRLGVLVASGALRGASARTMAVLQAFSEVVHDYQCPPDAVFWKDLNSYISPMIAYLETCRPKGVGVGNAIRWFKGEINRLGELHEASGASTEVDQKQGLMEAIRVYIRDRIVMAGHIVADNVKEKIKADDVVVVYARSSVVERALLEAFRDLQAQSPPASFDVVVVDSRPLHEGGSAESYANHRPRPPLHPHSRRCPLHVHSPPSRRNPDRTFVSRPPRRLVLEL